MRTPPLPRRSLFANGFPGEWRCSPVRGNAVKITIVQQFEVEKLKKRGLKFRLLDILAAKEVRSMALLSVEVRVITAMTEGMVKEEFGHVEVVVIDPHELYPGDTVYLWGEKSGRDFWLEMEVLPS